MASLSSFAVVLFLVFGLASKVRTARTFNECLQYAHETPNQKVFPGVRLMSALPLNPTRQTYLYKSEQPQTWCQSYAFCESVGKRLAVAKEKPAQDLWTTGLDTKGSGLVWVSARRKDFGANWTWLSDDMAPCTAEQGTLCGPRSKAGPAKPVGKLVRVGDNRFDLYVGPDKLPYSICSSSESEMYTEQARTWYEAMNACAMRYRKGRLAVYSEVNKTAFSGVRNFWVGLYYRPWIWVEGGKHRAMISPVYLSSWGKNADRSWSQDGCLAINASSGGQWVAVPCGERLNYILCEQDTGPVTTSAIPVHIPEVIPPSPPMTSSLMTSPSAFLDKDNIKVTTSSVGLIIGCTVGGVVILISVGGAVILIRKRRSSNVVRCRHPNADRRQRQQNEDDGGNKYFDDSDVYSIIRNSKIYNTMKKITPDLPPRDDTYNQPFEDSRKQDDGETDLPKTRKGIYLSLFGTFQREKSPEINLETINADEYLTPVNIRK